MDKSSKVSVTKKTGSSFLRSKSKDSYQCSRSRSGHLESNEGLRFSNINTEEDVIQHFFDQLAEFIIEDFVYVEENKPNEQKKEPQEERSSSSQVKEFKNITIEDLIGNNEIASVHGSKIILKSRKDTMSSVEKKLRASTQMLKETLLKRFSKSSAAMKRTSSSSKSNHRRSSERLRSKSSTTKSSFSVLSSVDEAEETEKDARIVFLNGNVYEGGMKKKLMHGKGKFSWTDGTVYEGDFMDGYPTGQGEMILPDLSFYNGQFHHGFFHGKGFLNVVGTTMFYNGNWKHGQKQGKGWILYEPNNWYEGEWFEELRHGFGLRVYKSEAKYRGEWLNGKQHGHGTMIWENNDYYKGEWFQGLFHGYGEYIWDAFVNDKSFAFAIQNVFKGNWIAGKRSGQGTMKFGAGSGSKMKGLWEQNFKQGEGHVICGNGKTVSSSSLFQTDKAVTYIESEESLHRFSADVPVFTVAELVDVGFYVNKILEKVPVPDPDKLQTLKAFEEKYIGNTLIIFLPRLLRVYRKYCLVGAKQDVDFEPVMVRMFLWQFFQDIDIVGQLGLSLVDIDKLLAENPSFCLDTLHYPFEEIYFWQFLMSLIALALSTTSLDNICDSTAAKGVSSLIFKTFLEEKVFSKLDTRDGSNMFSYMNMVPIKSIYSLYQELGEPHTARTFLRHTCLKKRQQPFENFELNSSSKIKLKPGMNVVLLADRISFITDQNSEAADGDNRVWNNLQDFRRLGPRNVTRCLSEVCPLIKSEGVIANMEYPLTFLEFYQTVLKCSFLVHELEIKLEKKPLVQAVEAVLPPPKPKSAKSNAKIDVEKTLKGGKKSKKGKSKTKM